MFLFRHWLVLLSKKVKLAIKTCCLNDFMCFFFSSSSCSSFSSFQAFTFNQVLMDLIMNSQVQNYKRIATDNR